MIVAQSGSGKSFFLGRLIEEILIRTKSSCVVLDPNGDFTQMQKMEKSSRWRNSSYSLSERRGWLPHEASRKVFADRWNEIALFVMTSNAKLRNSARNTYRDLRVWWPALSVDLLIEDVDPVHRHELYHIHEFVKSLQLLVLLRAAESGHHTDLIAEAQKLFHANFAGKSSRDISQIQHDIRASLDLDYRSIRSRGTWLKKLREFDALSWAVLEFPLFKYEDQIDSAIEGVVRAAASLEYVSSEMVNLYFGQASEFKRLGRLAETPDQGIINRERVLIVDLDSLNDTASQLLAINATLERQWEISKRERESFSRLPPESDERAPTFIVVDEAHRFIAADANTRAELVLRQQFRRIAAEGRKYGLFLILVSQRPDKLDPLILSECENKAVMRIGSTAVLCITRDRLGLEDVPVKLTERCLEFETGRVLIVGRWSPSGPRFLYSAARRTLEGGRSLRSAFWATPGQPRAAITRLFSEIGDLLVSQTSGHKRSTRSPKL